MSFDAILLQNNLGVLLFGLLPFYFRKRIGVFPCVAWSFFILQTSYTAFVPGEFPPAVMVAIQSSAKDNLLRMIALPFLIMFLKKSTINTIKNGLVIFLALMAVWSFVSPSQSYSMFTGLSFDTAIMGAIIPFAPLWLIPLFLASIIYVGGATAAVAAAVSGLAISVAKKKYKLTALFVAAAIAYGYLKLDLSDSGRLKIWAQHMDIWLAKGKYWFGLGNGSYEWLGALSPVDGSRYSLMHNDWLQILFESGIIGLSIVVMLAGYILIKARRNWRAFSCVCSLLSVAFFYYPMHTFITEFLILLLVREILDDRSVSARTC